MPTNLTGKEWKGIWERIGYLARYDYRVVDICLDAIPYALRSYDPNRGMTLATWIRTRVNYAAMEPKKPFDGQLSEVPEERLTYTIDFDAPIWWEQLVESLIPSLRELAELVAQGYTFKEAGVVLGIADTAVFKRAEKLRKAILKFKEMECLQ